MKKKPESIAAFYASYVKDLEEAFQEALKNKNFATAIKAKELQAKALEKQAEDALRAKAAEGHAICLEDLSDGDLDALIKDLEGYPLDFLQDMPEFKALKQALDQDT